MFLHTPAGAEASRGCKCSRMPSQANRAQCECIEARPAAPCVAFMPGYPVSNHTPFYVRQHGLEHPHILFLALLMSKRQVSQHNQAANGFHPEPLHSNRMSTKEAPAVARPTGVRRIPRVCSTTRTLHTLPSTQPRQPATVHASHTSNRVPRRSQHTHSCNQAQG